MHALIGVQRLLTTSPACSSVRNVVSSVNVFLQAPMGTRRSVLATITGRLREEAPNALEALYLSLPQVLSRSLSLSLHIVCPLMKSNEF